ncbi:coproporphyrinogen III oxidase [Amylibacter sp. SFDW26]|uniref:radical SAM family heme chaperone HemW n=1 Tax=Amylibacter sp. SFDW26 TaxID=2652722 RepID=UPI0012624A3C|nr:radical SAM family heme chaperone HemW [Amylibacter sp. SFDW26]KAB7614559.1 coproporphyrinogen III oxidase [Amylibacter sp. SFDW26]
MTEDWQNGGFGIYVHWPFCQSKCPYCDFNSHVRQNIDHSVWKDALLSELRHAALLTPDRSVQSIFFGGGTPSLMAPETVGAIIDEVAKLWHIGNDVEVTLEANPTSIEAGKFAAFNTAGINRVSMGAQALNDRDLQRLGRLHTAAEAIQAFDIAKENFKRVSFDLIYARQDQSLSDWQAELTKALGLAIDHLSLYQLTIENGTRFGELYDRGKLLGLPDDGLAADMYQATQDICATAGLNAYEVSNHAKAGSESRHNLIYWRYGDYVGIGPGAHGRITHDGIKQATEALRSPEDWLNTVQNKGSSFVITDKISKTDQAEEYLMMSLRLSEGTDLARFKTLSGCALDTNKIDDLTSLNLVQKTDDRLIATSKGRMILNSVLKELLT